MVYATCSILPSENQRIAKFLTTDIGKEFNFIKDQKNLASESGFDGFIWLFGTKRRNYKTKEKRFKRKKALIDSTIIILI
jgi:16S rRNA (cytosine967-C5)-methyltransferase